eukprot:SM000072S21234  [mRNA]  locus=s72:468687:471132:- [translate_table: standard]
MAPGCPPDFVEVGAELAGAAGRIVLQYFRQGLAVEDKQDLSPVTIADRKAEAAMRAILRERLPSHAIYGEEEGLEVGHGDGEWFWVLDPIDGTKSFITGKPLFGTLIALLHRGVPVLGVIDQPVLRERWIGVQGQPTTLNGTPIRVRPCKDIASAYMYSTTPHMFVGQADDAFQRIRSKVKMPLYGCDCYAYGLLAAGHVDLVVEADLKPYDYMALVPVIEGAGGHITDWRGNSLNWSPFVLEDGEVQLAAGEVVAAGDSAVHRAALAALAWH